MNAVLIFKLLKVPRHASEAANEDDVTLFEYINGFYSPRRRHSALDWKNPVAFERKAA